MLLLYEVSKIILETGSFSFLKCLLYVCVLNHFSHVTSLRLYGLQPARLLCPWDSPGKNSGVDYHGLLQWIFLTRDQTLVSYIFCSIGRQVPYHQHHRESPKMFTKTLKIWRLCRENGGQEGGRAVNWGHQRI